MNAQVPIRRATVQEIVANRNKALALYAQAHADIAAASETLARAADMARLARASTITRYNYANDRDRDEEFIGHLKVPDREKYLAGARKHTDTNVWSYLISITDLERLMDKTAKDQFCQQLMSDPPEVTEENVFATLDQFFMDSDTIFKRGIAKCFSDLDRRFKSHDGWKIGSRVILSYMFDGNGSYNYRRNHEDTLIDIERTFMVLDGRKPNDAYTGIVGELRNARRIGSGGARRDEVESDFFTVRAFKNGNAHVWFKRDDLVEKVNKLLGDYYNAGIPEERESEDDGGLSNPKTSLAKNAGWFPTPDAAAAKLIEAAYLRNYDDRPPLTVMEPSAGLGALALRCAKEGAVVDCIEIDGLRSSVIQGHPALRSVRRADFLAVAPTELYDRVVANPPFDRERDIDHVMHALKFLRPDGFLCAIMSAGTEFRETRKSIAFRELMAKMNAHFDDLPAGSFSSVGTNCNTLILRVYKDGRHFYR